ncbi:MAG: AI-2E family transporter [Xanthomonadales bacterium]|jgi:predicted PurR-regulated permease PerM|nr:AI-2E family transporter [Xanthomonadales bacterium]
MNQPANVSTVRTAIEIAVNLLLIFVILYWCLNILKPFISIIAWAGVIAIAMYKPFQKLQSLLGGSRKLALLLFTVFGLATVIVPAVLFVGSIIDSAQSITSSLESGDIDIQPPSENVKDWPLVGDRVYTNWSQAATNFEDWLENNADLLKGITGGLLSRAADLGLGIGVLQFIISTLIAAAFLANAETIVRGLARLFRRLVGDDGENFMKLSGATVTSVAVGVLGISFIQSFLAGVGMMAVGVPAAGMLALVVLVLCIAQLPPWLVLFPVIAYVFSVESTSVASVFAVWAIAVSFLDMVLKPIFLGRGVEAPMLVILLGAIGGMLMSGILGLFVGAVVLALGYKLFEAWLTMHDEDPEAEEAKT